VSAVEPLQGREIRVFPNPAAEEVWFHLPQGTHVRVKIWNIADGRLVKEITGTSSKEAWSLDVASWAAGTYIVAAYMDDEKPVIRKLVVAH
jgi:hypothetical protein